MLPVWLVAAPPMAPEMWGPVARRLEGHFQPQVLDLVDGEHGDSSVEALAQRLVQRLGPQPRGLLVAHGLAVPVAMAVGAAIPGLPLVLANGPIGSLHPLVASLSALSRRMGPLVQAALHPRLSAPALASSLALRRAVRNPYVMDRDTVVAICVPSLCSPRRREATRQLLLSLPQALRSTAPIDGPALLVWGDEDRLHPPAMVDAARQRIPLLSHHRVGGGRFLHPVEQPWDLADSIIEWWAQLAPRHESRD